MLNPIKKILVANRGEIAVRVIRAARELGIASVAVYSEADRVALHVRHADEAYAIGPSPALESYLRIEKILEAARRSGADAIHPGYGFLSENADFAQACTDARVKFIGPSAAAMRLMGSKTSARQAVEKAGLPRVPGSSRSIASIAEAREIARQVGYPIMIKAAAGGGGKGMRVVTADGDLASACEAAQSEAKNAFGNSAVYIEKFIANPRHIEIQILGDEHGNAIYLGERECSIQRRHQKVIEEAPSPVVDADLRRRMGDTAVEIARSAGYYNAGTIEFLIDEARNFYFLEMNTRLQVEHPVTELVTGIDLVRMQILIAQGEPLPFQQSDIRLRGHAIECRIYAEDPNNNFFPSPGKITALTVPSGPGIRLDSGVYEGWTVPLEYDPLLSKLIAHAETRDLATDRLSRALGEYQTGGIATNLDLFRAILRDDRFRRGEIDTGFLDRWLKERAPGSAELDRDRLRPIAALGAALFASQESQHSAQPMPASSVWKRTARLESLRSS